MGDQSNPESDEDVDIGFRLASKLGGINEDKDYDTDDEIELYGISPTTITILMALATLFLPVGGIGLMYNISNIAPILYGVFWVSDIPSILFAWLWYIYNPVALLSVVWLTAPLCIFNFLYIKQISRFYYGKTSRDIVLFYGILSMIVPSAISVILWTSSVLPFVITPLPFQFFAGVYLLYKYNDPDLLSPWQGYFLDLSWWTRKLYSIHEPNQKVINLTKLLMDHDADWLEGWSDEGYENE